MPAELHAIADVPEPPLADGVKVNILLVDDQQGALVALQAMLEDLGQNLVVARSGREALKHLLQQEFALILLDVVMPEMDGFETAAVIRSRPKLRDVPIIFLTGLTRGELPPSRAYSLGAVDYMLKPIDAQVLRSKVMVLVDLARKTEIVRQQAARLADIERRRHAEELTQARERLEVERARARTAALRHDVEVAANQERWLRAVFDATPSPLMLIEAGTARRVLVNQAARTIGGGALLDGRAAGARFYDGAGRLLVKDALPCGRAARGERLSGFEMTWELDGARGTLLVYSEALPAFAAQGPTVLLVFQDVTSLKVVEGDLRDAVRAREDFLSVASHELRTPLTAALLQLGSARRACTLSEGLTVTPELSEKLEKSEKSLRRLGRLVDELLDLSRMAAGKVELELTDVDLARVVEEAAGRAQDQLTRAGCRLTVDAAPTVGRWDTRRLDQVVTNLLTNAMKYGRGKPLEITVGADEATARLAVRDHGIGIAPEDRARLFERFERLHGDDRRGGFGLGLWIVKRIVEELGGSIEVESKPGTGATFTVVLPRARADRP